MAAYSESKITVGSIINGLKKQIDINFFIQIKLWLYWKWTKTAVKNVQKYVDNVFYWIKMAKKAKLVIQGNKNYIDYLSGHLQKEHPKTKGKVKVM